MIDLDALLAPISPDSPCGEDISYRPEFLELDPLLRGKEETQFSGAVQPDWKRVHQRCLDLFQISKHLQVATVFCVTSLKTGGLVDAAAALNLLAGLLERYWESLYPRLDPNDHLDPLERMNILGSLAAPLGTFGDNIRFLERLREAPLTDSPVLGRLSFNDVHREATEDKNAPAPLDPAQIDAAFRDTSLETLTATQAAVESAAAAVRKISARLADVPGGDQAPSFAPLLQQFAELGKTLAPYLAVPTPAAAESAPGQPPPLPSTGVIANRNDVVAALDRLCAYYLQNEPSSPVPLLLKRARRLVHADFMGILADLAPDAVAQARSATGTPDAPA